MKIQRYEDLIAWQKARELTRRIYEVTRGAGFERDFRLVDQIRSASVSVMSNLAEGFERGSTADFLRFVYMAKGSAAEVRSQLQVAVDVGYLSPAQFDRLKAEADELGNVLGGLRKSLESRREKP
jgi:four helix bundle protein